jgi:hypothetical protein
MAGQFTIAGLAAGLASGAKTIGPNTITGGSAIGQISDLILVTGDNTFTVPAGATAVAVFISTTNTSAIKFRTSANAADAGLPINPAGPWIAWPLVAGTTSVIINAASGGASVELNFI